LLADDDAAGKRLKPSREGQGRAAAPRSWERDEVVRQLDIAARAIKAESVAHLARRDGHIADQRPGVGTGNVRYGDGPDAFPLPPTDKAGRRHAAGVADQRLDFAGREHAIEDLHLVEQPVERRPEVIEHLTEAQRVWVERETRRRPRGL